MLKMSVLNRVAVVLVSVEVIQVISGASIYHFDPQRNEYRPCEKNLNNNQIYYEAKQPQYVDQNRHQYPTIQQQIPQYQHQQQFTPQVMHKNAVNNNYNPQPVIVDFYFYEYNADNPNVIDVYEIEIPERPQLRPETTPPPAVDETTDPPPRGSFDEDQVVSGGVETPTRHLDHQESNFTLTYNHASSAAHQNQNATEDDTSTVVSSTHDNSTDHQVDPNYPSRNSIGKTGGQVVRNEFERNQTTGEYRIDIEFADGTKRWEIGELKKDANNSTVFIILGFFTYLEDDILKSVPYKIDPEKGFILYEDPLTFPVDFGVEGIADVCDPSRPHEVSCIDPKLIHTMLG